MAGTNQAKIFDLLFKLPENQLCADCDCKAPRWASTTFGVLVCLRCAGNI